MSQDPNFRYLKPFHSEGEIGKPRTSQEAAVAPDEEDENNSAVPTPGKYSLKGAMPTAERNMERRSRETTPLYGDLPKEGRYTQKKDIDTFQNINDFDKFIEGLSSDNDAELGTSLMTLNKLIRDKDNEVTRSRGELGRMNRMAIFDPLQGTPFSQLSGGTLEPPDVRFLQNLDQLRTLQKAKKEILDALKPIAKEERDYVFNEIVEGATYTDLQEKYGIKYANKVLQGEFQDDWQEKEREYFEYLKTVPQLDPKRFNTLNVSKIAASPMTFNSISQKEIGEMITHFRKDTDYSKSDYKKREQIFADYAKKKAKEKYPDDEKKRNQAEEELFNAYVKFGYYQHHPEMPWADLLYNYGMDMEEAVKAAEDADQLIDRNALVPSVHGSKKFTETLIEQVTAFKEILSSIDAQVRLNSTRGPAMGSFGDPTLPGQSMLQNIPDPAITELLRKTDVALDYMNQTLKIPEEKSVSGFWGKSGLGYTPLVNHATLGVKEMSDLLSVLAINKKLNRGEDLDFIEKQLLTAYAVHGNAEAQDTFKKWAQIGQGVADMVPYIAMFAATSGVYSATKEATLAGTKHLTKKITTDQFRNKIVKKTSYSYVNHQGKKVVSSLPEMAALHMSRITGAAAQTLAMPQFYMTNISRRLIDQMEIYQDPEYQELALHVYQNSADPLDKAIRRGMWEHFSEVVTERAGPYLMAGMKKPLKWAAKPIGKTAAGKKIAQGVQKASDAIGDKFNIGEYSKVKLLKEYMRVKGFKTWKETQAHIVKNKMGWNGVFEEYMEEFVNYWMAEAFTRDEEGKLHLYDWSKHNWGDWLDEQIVTAGTVAIFGGVMGSVQFGTELRIGPNTKLSYRVGMKTHEVKIPNRIFDQIAPHITEKHIDQKAVSDIISKHVKDGTLNKEQAHALFTLLINETVQKTAKNIVGHEREREEKREGKEEYTPVELTTQEDMGGEITSVDSEIQQERKKYNEERGGLQKKEAVITNSLENKEKKEETSQQNYEKKDKAIDDKIDGLNKKLNNKKITPEQRLTIKRQINAAKTQKKVLWDNRRGEAAENKIEINKLKKERGQARTHISNIDKSHNSKMKNFDKRRIAEYEEIRETRKKTEEDFAHEVQDYEQRSTAIDNKVDQLNQKLNDKKTPAAEKQKIQRQIIAAKAQKTKLWNSHQKKIVGLKKASSLADRPVNNTPKITEEERKEIDAHNEEVKKNFPDLAEYGLLEMDDFTGQLEAPTLEHLEVEYEKVTNLIKAINERTMEEYNAIGQVVNISAEVERLVDKQMILEKYLHLEQQHQLIPWDRKLPSEKWAQIAHEMLQGKIDKIQIEYKSRDAFKIILPDGRKATAYYDKELDKKEKEKTRKAITNNEELDLVLEKKEEWNPEDKHKDRDGNVYGDRISVRHKGKHIGSIEISDIWEIKEYGHRAGQAGKRAKNAIAKAWAAFTEAEEHSPDKPVKMGPPSPAWMTDPQKAKKLLQAIYEALDAIADYLRYSTEELIAILKKELKQDTELDPKFRQALLMTINEKNEDIVRHIMKKRFEAKGFIVKAQESFDAKSLIVPSMEQPHWTEKEKMEVHLRSYANLWREISQKTGISRERIEAEFIRFVHGMNWAMVVNEETKNEFLRNQIGENDILNGILLTLQGVNFDTFISIVDFYDNVRVIKHQQLLISDKGIQITELSTGLRYEEFVENLVATLKDYKYEISGNTYEGYEAIKIRLRDHTNERYQRESKVRSLMQEEGTLEQRSVIRKAQYEADLELLQELTGISKEMWRSYMENKRTLEREAITNPSNRLKTKFGSYEQLLEADTYNVYTDSKGNKKVHIKMHSDLAFNLLNTIKDATLQQFEKRLNDFFLKGKFYAEKETKQSVFSNIYKLATSIDQPDNYALSAIDVKGDRIPLMLQYNMVLKVADEILQDPRSNRIIDYYKAKGESMRIVVLNGMVGMDRSEPGKNSKEMSVSDVVLSNIFFFSQGDQAYMGNLGQFGDKHAIYYAEMPKAEMPTKEQIDELKKIFPDFNKAANWIYEDILSQNPSKFTEAAIDYEGKDSSDRLRNLAIHYTYNYAINTEASLNTFNGNREQYGNSLVKMVKRAGSSNSPGYRLNPHVDGGVGHTYSHAILNDKILFKKNEKEKGIEEEIGDGVVFMSGEMAAKMAKSMGSIYAKLDLFGNVLSSTKALVSFIDKESDTRGLMKGNWLNVDLLAAAMPNSVYAEIANLMKESNLDTVSFTSTTKLVEAGRTIANPFTNQGKLKKGFKLNPGEMFDRNTQDIFIQQDLRHQPEPEAKKQAAQLLSNILVLPRAAEVVMAISEMRKQQVLSFVNQFLGQSEKSINQQKLNWMREQLDETKDAEILELLDLGATANDPTIANMIRAKLANKAEKEALDLVMMRSTTQEIPDMDGQLEGFRLSKDGLHYLLPEAAIGDPFARVHDDRFSKLEDLSIEQRIDRAIAYVKENENSYQDLFDQDGNLMEWEIRERDGIIPGEPVMLTRVPADHPHSHTIARVKFRLPGNFSMLDKQSRMQSGSDFDGDMRYVTSFYKDKNGNIRVSAKDQGKKGLANSVLYNLMLDYMDPANNSYITAPINTKAFDAIAEKYIEQRNTNPLDPRAFFDSRNDNMVGVKLKGILTDVNTLYSTLSYIQAGFKMEEAFDINEGKVILRRFVSDKYGAMKMAFVNLQNMAFDNAADPKLEAMGINEHTVMMYVALLATDKKLDSNNFNSYEEHSQAILNAVDNLSAYFNTDLFRRYTEYMRIANSESSSKTIKSVNKDLQTDFPARKAEIAIIAKLEQYGLALREISSFLKLTREIPTDIVEFMTAKQLYNSIVLNKGGSEALSLFDTKSFFNSNGTLKSLFASAEQVIMLGEQVIYSDAVEYSPTMRKLYQKIYQLLKISRGVKQDKRTTFTKKQLKSLSRSSNNIARLFAIEPEMPFEQLEEYLVNKTQQYQEEMPGNSFINSIQVHKRHFARNPEVILDVDLMQARISPERLRKIQNDFDAIQDQQYKNAIYAYSLQKHAGATSTMKGSFFSLIGLKQRAVMSQLITDKLAEMENQFLIDPVTKYQMTQWMLRTAWDSDLRNLADIKKSFADKADITTIAFFNFPVDMLVLQEIIEAADAKEYNQIVTELGWKYSTEDYQGNVIWTDTFKNYIESLTEKKYKGPEGFKEFQKDIALQKEEFIKKAQKDFPESNPLSEDQLKNMLETDALQEALALEDPQLLEFITNKLQKEYPTVQFFNSYEDFKRFVEKWGGTMLDVSTFAIGHAFKNAVYINPEKARQSTAAHEYAHIYWDALPETEGSIKQRMREFYENNHPEGDVLFGDALDEKIILDIGRMTTNKASVEFRGSLWAKFLELVKDFWANVKNALGMASQKDFLRIISSHVWNNQESVLATPYNGNTKVWNMVINKDHELGLIEGHVHTIDGLQVVGVTELIGKTKSTKFDSKIQADIASKRQLSEIREITKLRIDEGFVEKEMDDLQRRYDAASEKGKLIHSIGEAIFNNTDMPEIAGDFFVSYFKDQSIKNSFIRIKNTIKEIWPEAEFKAEQQIASPEHRIAGFVDLIVDIGKNEKGENQLIIIDFKTAEDLLISDIADVTSKYTEVHGRRSGIAQSVPLSKEGDYKLQLHLYKEILEAQTDQQGNKNVVVSMYILPIYLILDKKQKIREASIKEVSRAIDDTWMGQKMKEKGIKHKIGWHEYNPKEQIPAKAAKALMQENKQSYDPNPEKYDRLRNMLRSYGFYDTAIDEMIKAHRHLSFSMGDLADITNFEISEMRRTGLVYLKDRWFALGYKADQIKTLPFEKLFYAAVHNIKPEDLEKNFKTFAIRNKYTHIEDAEIERGWYKFIMEFEGTPFEEKQERTVFDAEIGELEINDTVYLDFTFDMESGTEKSLFYKYAIIDISQSRRKLTLEDIDGSRKIVYLKKGMTILKEHKGDLPKGVNVKTEFTPRRFYRKETIEEEHFVGEKSNIYSAEERIGKSGTAEWGHYKRSLFKVWNFFDKIQTFNDFLNWLDDRKAIEDFYEKSLRGAHNEPAQELRDFVSETLVDHWFAEGIREENKLGLEQFMPLTMQFYYMLTEKKETFFKDFRTSSTPNWTKNLINPEFIQGDYVPFTMLYQDLAKKMREITNAKYDNNIVIDELYSHIEPIEKDLVIEMQGRMYWMTPKEAQRQGYDEKVIRFLTHVIEQHRKFDLDYKQRLEVEDILENDVMTYGIEERVPVAMLPFTKKELGEKYGRFARNMDEFLRDQPYDNELVTVKERIRENGIVKFKTVQVEKDGNMVDLRARFVDVKREFLRSNMSRQDLRKFFGSEIQRRMQRIPFLGTSLNTGSLYNYYKQEAIKQYKKAQESGERNALARQGRRLPSLRQANPMYSSQKYLAAEQKRIDMLIFDHHMKNFLAPVDYMLTKYRESHAVNAKEQIKDSNIANYIQTQLDNTIFSTAKHGYDKDYQQLVNMLVRWTSLAVMAYGVNVQIFNLGIGWINNVAYEPAAFARGIGRMFGYDTDLGKVHFDQAVTNMLKAYRILRRYGLANMVEETKFEALDRFHNRYLNAAITEKIENYGYLFLELAEKTIQIPIFAGMMTQEEWNAYDNHATVVNENNQLTSVRADELTRRVAYIHGFYAKHQQAPFTTTPEGHAFFQFKKWMLSLWFKYKRQHHFDRGYMIRSGMIDSYKMAAKLGKLFVMPQSKRMEYIGETMKDMKIESFPFAMRGISDFYGMILQELSKKSEVQKRDIWNSLSAQDKKNMISLPTNMLIALSIWLALGAGGDDDETAWQTRKRRLKYVFLMRFVGDIFYFFNRDNIEHTISQPMAATGLVINVLKFGVDLMNWITGDPKGRYQDDTIFWYDQMPKAYLSFMRIIPFGSGVKDSWNLLYGEVLKHRPAIFPDGSKIRINEDKSIEIVKELFPGDEFVTLYDLRESPRLKEIKEQYVEGKRIDEAKKSGVDLVDAAKKQAAVNKIKAEVRKLKDYVELVNLAIQKDDPDSDYSKTMESRKDPESKKTRKEIDRASGISRKDAIKLIKEEMEKEKK